jgi:hypothetical protein
MNSDDPINCKSNPINNPRADNMNENQPPTSKNNLQTSIEPVNKAIPPIFRMRKQCQLAISRSGHVTQKRENKQIEDAYMRVLGQAKKILAEQPQQVFERNQRRDNTENAFTMHSFLSKGFFFELSCDISCNYQVEYAFNNCSNEQEIRLLLHAYPLNSHAKEVKLKPDFSTFYAAVLAFQDKKYTYLLKV